MRFNCCLLAFLAIFFITSILLSSVNANTQEDDFAEFDELYQTDSKEVKTDSQPERPTVRSTVDAKLSNDQVTGNEELPQVSSERSNSSEEQDEDEDDGVQIEDGFEDELKPISDKKKSNAGPETKPKTLNITNIPFHLRNNWQSYYIEICLLALLFGYFVNYISGSASNRMIADVFLKTNESFLQSLFTIVGDDGGIQFGRYIKESEHFYTLWCTGRNGLECAVFELKLIKRQDLISRLLNIFKPSNDELIVKLFLNEDTMDTYVFCLANRGAGLKQMRELNDVQTYCTQRKERFGLTDEKLLVLSEIGDVGGQLFDNQTISSLNALENQVNYIHISDQFSGPKVVEDTPQTKMPDVKKVMTLSFNLSGVSAVAEESNKFVQFTFLLVEKVKRLRLKKDLKLKAQKNRQKVEDIYQRAAHALRQEQAQQKREEKLRLEKEKILQENDQQKLRKLEEKEYKREMKRRAPKVKQFKLK